MSRSPSAPATLIRPHRPNRRRSCRYSNNDAFAGCARRNVPEKNRTGRGAGPGEFVARDRRHSFGFEIVRGAAAGPDRFNPRRGEGDSEYRLGIAAEVRAPVRPRRARRKDRLGDRSRTRGPLRACVLTMLPPRPGYGPLVRRRPPTSCLRAVAFDRRGSLVPGEARKTAACFIARPASRS